VRESATTHLIILLGRATLVEGTLFSLACTGPTTIAMEKTETLLGRGGKCYLGRDKELPFHSL